MPLAEIIFDFFDQIKSRSRGYASYDYELCGYQESDLVKLYSHLSLSNKQLFLPYSPLQCLQLLLSPNR